MSDMSLPPAIFLMGPTASGKTEVAMQLVKDLPCDIISVDSALVYRGMNIGTAKPSVEELKRAPHRLIDICEPTESYSAARFRADALREMERISAAGRIPLLVGGTMLYFRALQYGLSPLPQADNTIRAELLAEAKQSGWQAMHQQLAAIDAEAAARIHPNDPQRIQRALEVYRITGMPMTQVQSQKGEALAYRVLKLVWAPYSREQLRERIALRFHQMLEAGFEAEVRQLLDQYNLSIETPSMRSVGYRQMLAYILSNLDHATMVDKGIAATRQLAKRQLTWLRKEHDAVWLERQDQLREQLLTFGVN